MLFCASSDRLRRLLFAFFAATTHPARLCSVYLLYQEADWRPGNFFLFFFLHLFPSIVDRRRGRARLLVHSFFWYIFSVHREYKSFLSSFLFSSFHFLFIFCIGTSFLFCRFLYMCSGIRRYDTFSILVHSILQAGVHGTRPTILFCSIHSTIQMSTFLFYRLKFFSTFLLSILS